MNFFGRARIAVLLVLASLAAAALSAPLIAGGAPSFGISIKFAAMIVVGCVIGFFRFRSIPIALGAALGSLPGAAFALCVAQREDIAFAFGLPIAIVYTLGFVLALIAGDRFVGLLVEDMVPEAAAFATWRSEAPLIAAILGAAVAIPGLLAIAGPRILLGPCLLVGTANALSILSASLATPLLGSIAATGEDFIARSNRARERWIRWMEALSAASRPPWTVSTAGIFIVFGALAFFGDAGEAIAASVRAHLDIEIAAALVVSLGAAYAVGRDLRRAFSVCAAAALCVMMCIWGYGRSASVLDPPLLFVTAEFSVLALVPMVAVAARASTPMPSAPPSAGPAAATSGLAALLLFAPWFEEAGAARLGLFLGVVFFSIGALVFQPALAAGLETLVPRRRSMAERYRVK